MSEEELANYDGSFYKVLRTQGYSVKDSQALNKTHEKNLAKVGTILAHLTLRRTVPIEVFDSAGGWDNLSKSKKEHILWMAGINAKDYPYCKDLGEYHLGSKFAFGAFVVGQERCDKQWINLKIGGCRVASDEAYQSYRKPTEKRKEVGDELKLKTKLTLA